jgi:tetratricopeptide (TPR) repeat protein
MSDADIERIERWVEQGALEGDARDLPAPPHWAEGWQLGEPDLILSMPEPYTLKPEGADELRTFVIPVPISTPRSVRAYEFREGSSRAVHHANIKIDPTRLSRRFDDEEPGPGYEGGGSRAARFPDGHFLGWTPGQSPQVPADGTGWALDPGTDLVVELHLMPTGKIERIQVSVGFFFSDRPEANPPSMLRLGRQDLDIAGGDARYVSSDSYTLPVDVRAIGVQPHAHFLAKEIYGAARLPDGRTKPLILIKSWDFRWQDVYTYSAPLYLPKGTTLLMRYTYDNSATNPRNPNRPPRRVTFGQTSASEMGDLWVQVQTGTPADRERLERDIGLKMLRQDIAGDEKVLEVHPRDARTRADLAACYIDAGRTDDAIAQLRASLSIEPSSPGVHYDLGSVLLSKRLFDQAGDEFEAAARLKPDFSEALNNVGVVRQAQGRPGEALEWYDRAARANEKNALAHYNLARALAVQNRTAEAVLHYQRALQLNPDDAASRVNLATLFVAAHRVDEAVGHYRRALQAQPDLPAALVDLAWILATSERSDLHRPEEAIRLAERAAALTRRENPTVLDTLAVAYEAAGQRERAIAVEQTALALASASGQLELTEQIRLHMERFKNAPRR